MSDPVFQNHVEGTLINHPALAKLLCFEVTESVAVADPKTTHPFMERIRKLGVQFALDDFGKGVSSYGYLRKLPVNILKIDGEFVQNLAKDAFNRVTVKNMVEIAKVLELKTVAEFVEDEETLKELSKIGVDYYQGYLIHKPEPLTNLLNAALEQAV